MKRETPYTRWGKRAIDIVGALILLAIVSGPLLLLSLVLLVVQGRPVFFSAPRIGRGGRSFSIVKFRTMHRGAAENLTTVLAMSREAREEFARYYKLSRDPRITPIGRILRKWSIDEVPQLINVVLGTMSLVGPRPVTRQELVDYYRGDAALVTSLRPGLSGLWQVSGRSEIDYATRVALEVQYVTTVGLAGDLRILARTIPAVLVGHGAV